MNNMEDSKAGDASKIPRPLSQLEHLPTTLFERKN